MKGFCPYCKAELVPAPRRKKKCPECGQTMYVRDGKLLQEFDALQVDWLVFLSSLNVKKRDFDQTRKSLKKQTAVEPSFFDVVRNILDEVIARGSSEDKVRAYHELSRAASWEGGDPSPYIEAGLRETLEEMKRRSVKTVKVNNYGGYPDYSTCEDCAALHGKAFSIDDALSSMPVPSKCSRDDGWCRCEYISVYPQEQVIY